jgi:tetratricopeptide (TPR) repeat protein
MTIHKKIKFLAGSILLSALVSAQSIPVAKQPQPKSQKEVDAIMALQNAMQKQDYDGSIKAAEELLTKFADTEFKPMALQVISGIYQAKGDAEKAIIYAERLLEADPKSYTGMILIATLTAQQTREHDLDREEKLKKVEKMALGARELVKDAPKPRPDLTDEQWIAFRKDITSQTHEAMGMAAQARKNTEGAIEEFKKSIEVANTPDPATMVRLGSLYVASNKPDEAIAILDRAAADPQATAQLKQVAASEKEKATKMKSGDAPAASAPKP